MDIILNIPQQAATQVNTTIGSIQFDTHNKTALVSIYRPDQGHKQVNVDVNAILAQATQLQLDSIALFFRAVIANSLGITIAEVPNSIWL